MTRFGYLQNIFLLFFFAAKIEKHFALGFRRRDDDEDCHYDDDDDDGDDVRRRRRRRRQDVVFEAFVDGDVVGGVGRRRRVGSVVVV